MSADHLPELRFYHERDGMHVAHHGNVRVVAWQRRDKTGYEVLFENAYRGIPLRRELVPGRLPAVRQHCREVVADIVR